MQEKVAPYASLAHSAAFAGAAQFARALSFAAGQIAHDLAAELVQEGIEQGFDWLWAGGGEEPHPYITLFADYGWGKRFKGPGAGTGSGSSNFNKVSWLGPAGMAWDVTLNSQSLPYAVWPVDEGPYRPGSSVHRWTGREEIDLSQNPNPHLVSGKPKPIPATRVDRPLKKVPDATSVPVRAWKEAQAIEIVGSRYGGPPKMNLLKTPGGRTPRERKPGPSRGTQAAFVALNAALDLTSESAEYWEILKEEAGIVKIMKDGRRQAAMTNGEFLNWLANGGWNQLDHSEVARKFATNLIVDKILGPILGQMGKTARSGGLTHTQIPSF